MGKHKKHASRRKLPDVVAPTWLDLRGVVPKRGNGEFSEERAVAKKALAERVVEAIKETPMKREPGSGKGQILYVADNFEPLDDFEE